MQPLVSIIIPAYNVENYMANCLNSVFDQSYKNLEVIIIDDCSTDKTRSTICKLIEHYNDQRFKLLNLDSNVGVSTARNIGIRNSSGELIYFLDSDDDILPDCIEDLVTAYIDTGADIVIAENYFIESSKKNTVQISLPEGYYKGGKVVESFCRRLWNNQVWNKLIKKELITRNNIFFAEGLTLEDELFSLQIALNANALYVLKKPTYNYYIRQGSIIRTAGRNLGRWLTFSSINRLMSDYIVNHGFNRNPFVARYFLENVIVNLSQIHRLKKLEYPIFRDITSLYYYNLITLYKQGYLSIKELIAYYYLNLAGKLGYSYFKLINFLFSVSKRKKMFSR